MIMRTKMDTSEYTGGTAVGKVAAETSETGNVKLPYYDRTKQKLHLERYQIESIVYT